MIKLNPNLRPPENESEEHFLLKQVAMAVLYLRMDCLAVGTEIWGMDEQDSKRLIQFSRFLNGGPIQMSNCRPIRNITDTAGISSAYSKKRNPDGTLINKKEYTVRSIEAKVSLSDLQSGYCVGADLNYIIAPLGLIKPKMIFPGVGLIEVDFKTLAWTYKQYRDFLEGVTMPIKATRVKRDIYYLGSRENWIMDILCNITFQNMKEQTSKGKWFYPKYTAKEASLS